MTATSSFGRIRSYLWPIHRHELKFFIPLFLIFFFIGFNYALLRAVKDTAVITAPNSGAEVLPFLKLWAVIPFAFLFTFLLTRVSNRFSREKVFYVLMSIFVSFFLLYLFVLYPFRDSLHPHVVADKLQAVLPQGCKGLVALFRNWTFTLFYVMSEMWSAIILTVLAWGFANEVSSVRDARRYYGLLGLSLNCATMLAGYAAALFSKRGFSTLLPFGQTPWDQTVFFLMSIIIVFGLIAMALFRYIHVKKLGYNSPTYQEKEGGVRIKMGMRKNFAYLMKSKYLLCISVLVLMFNIALTLIEVMWKDQVRQLHPDPAQFNAYMGSVLMWVGVVSTLASLFVSGSILRKFNWTTSAMITPLLLLVTGVLFFFFCVFKDSSFAAVATFLGSTPLGLCAFLGSLQNCLARASKYTLFDATKELAFIPLSKECKLKGKSAIDGVGSRIGKSGAALAYQGLIMGFGSVALSTPCVGVILLLVISGWMVATRALGKQFNQLITSQTRIDDPDALTGKEEGASAMSSKAASA